jgi:hypothetical protein
MAISRLVIISVLAALFFGFAGSISCSQPVETPPEGKGIPPPPFMKTSSAPPSGKPVIQAFDISPDIIRTHLGQASTLHWNVQDANSIYITNIGYVPPMGSMAIKPNQGGIYTLTAVNVNGSVSISKKLTVEP